MKHFIITIDTEGDNLWDWKEGDVIRTENVAYLPRFQKLCEFYGFKPVWLTNFEMISDPEYVAFVSDVEARHTGELGMHLHAWNTPPEYHLPKAEPIGAPYLIEYPQGIMEEKIASLTDLIEARTGIRPISHRAGRWAMNDLYFEALKKTGYHVDCSVTPHESWVSHPGQTADSHGSDYLEANEEPYWIESENMLLEVPLTVRKTHRFFPVEKEIIQNKGIFSKKYARRMAGNLKRAFRGNTIWLRPHHSTEEQMMHLIRQIKESSSDYIMFMLHSSELMPGGSPNFKTGDDIEQLYALMDRLFMVAATDFKGTTLREYYMEKTAK